MGKKIIKLNKKDPRVEHRSKTIHQMRELSKLSGFEIVQHSYVNILLFPVFHKLIGRLNKIISSMISRKPIWRWLTKYSSTISVFQSPSNLIALLIKCTRLLKSKLLQIKAMKNTFKQKKIS